MQAAGQRFACTQCGKCCNRSPEVQLSEAAALADVFVFRLMFRLYALPRSLGDYVRDRSGQANAAEIFYQKRRLLSAHAALKRPAKVRFGGRPIESVQYLTISALSLDTSPGVCSAREDSRCGVYNRRPHACRTVPFHYSRVEASAEGDLNAFVTTQGYRCDTGEGAPVVIQAGRIVHADIRRARAEAQSLVEKDRPWKKAIVRRMKVGGLPEESVPSLKEIAEAASVGAVTTSMRVAWQIAAESGLIGSDQCQSLFATQLALVDRELAAGRCTQDARETLLEMRADYSRRLSAGGAKSG